MNKSSVLLFTILLLGLFLYGCGQQSTSRGDVTTKVDSLTESDLMFNEAFYFIKLNPTIAQENQAPFCTNCNPTNPGDVEKLIGPCSTSEVTISFYLKTAYIRTYNCYKKTDSCEQSNSNAVNCKLYVDDDDHGMTGYYQVVDGTNTYLTIPGYNIEYNKDHVLKICCGVQGNIICKTKVLEALCPKANT